MAGKFLNLLIVTPESILFQGSVSSLIVPGDSGYFGVLHDHAPILSSIKKGKIEFVDDNNKHNVMEISTGGFLEVANNKATIVLG